MEHLCVRGAVSDELGDDGPCDNSVGETDDCVQSEAHIGPTLDHHDLVELGLHFELTFLRGRIDVDIFLDRVWRRLCLEFEFIVTSCQLEDGLQHELGKQDRRVWRCNVYQGGEHVAIARSVQLEEFIRTVLVGVGVRNYVPCRLIVDIFLEGTNLSIPVGLKLRYFEALLEAVDVRHHIDRVNVAILDLLIDEDLLLVREPLW